MGIGKSPFMGFRLLFIVLLMSMHSFAQTPQVNELKESIPNLKGISKADCLNKISEQFIYHFIHSDSALLYAKSAYAESKKINYEKGKGLSLLLQAETVGKLLGNLDSMIMLCKQALSELQNPVNTALQSNAYRLLGTAYTLNGQIENADTALKLALEKAYLSGNKSSIGWAHQAIGFKYAKKGTYWKAFENLIESQMIGKQVNDSFLAAISLAFIARSFNYSGDPENALRYYDEFLSYRNNSFILLWPHYQDIGYAYLQLNQVDSAIYFQEKHKRNLLVLTQDKAIQERFRDWMIFDFSHHAKLNNKEYDKVLQHFLSRGDKIKKSENAIALMHAELMMAKAYRGKAEFNNALVYARKLKQNSNLTSNNYFRKEAFLLMSSLFEKINNTDSAYHYFRLYTTLKDSIDKEQFALRAALYTASEESAARMKVLENENKNKQDELALKEMQLQKQSQQKNLLFISLGVIIIIASLIFRNILLKRKNEKLKNEQEHSALKRKALELEMQALRAQMNPHFIFNCLSAIDNLVQTNQADKATSYLSRFAKLIRSVLDSSKSNLVPFQRDFETLKLYLEMEKFRCNNKFNYNLIVDKKLMNGDYKVPPMIIQPFVENAIHHGLLNKQDNDRQLNISAELQNEQIVYYVSDNGIGRKQAAEIKEINKPGQKSYGIDITRERISLYNKNGTNDIEIIDLEEGGICLGTKAMIRINS